MKMKMKCSFIAAAVMCFAGVGVRAESNTLTVISGVTSNNAGDYYVGNSGTNNVLIITNAGILNVTAYSASIFIGNSASANFNSVLVTGPGSTLNNAYYIEAGYWGSYNSLTLTNGGVVNASSVEVGEMTGANNNSLTVSGTNSALNVSSYLYIGYEGSNNRMTINKGGQVIHSGEWTLIGQNQGMANNNTVVVTDSGSVWSNSTDLYVGYGGDNCSLIITNGGRVFNNNGYISYVPNNGGNNVLVAGSNSLWRSSGALLIGDHNGPGSLIVSNGGTVVNTDARLGLHDDGADGNSVLVTGSGSVWTNTGSLNVGESTRNNTVTSRNGATVFIGGNVCIGVNQYSGNEIELEGGNLTATNAGNGLLEVRYGTLNLNGGALTVNTLLTTNNFTNATFNIFNFNYGTLTTLAGAQIVAPAGSDFNIGSTAGQTATWNILAGTNSITPVAGRSADTLLGNAAGAAANVAISGAGTLWTNSGALFIGYTNVANGSQVTISDGALVGNTKGYVGYASDNNSALVKDSGSIWNNAGLLAIGDHASGNRLTVTNGGQVASAGGFIGYTAASNNTVLVTGAGSLWNNTGVLYIGSNGVANQLAITNGGAVVNGAGALGYSATANNNSALVTGNNSVWSNNGSLYVGRLGSGNNLTIINGGAAVVAGTTWVGAAAGATSNRLVLNGGAFDTGGLIATNNTASATHSAFVFDYGTLTTRIGAQLVIPAGGNFGLGNTDGQTTTWNILGGTNNIMVVPGYSADTFLGNDLSAPVTVAVSGAGTVWNNPGMLYLGYVWSTDNSQLNISDGARVSNTKGYIGYDAAANTVTVSGAGSLWTNSDMLVVGQNTSGNRLTITNGGRVANTDVYISYTSPADNNSILVTGTGSVWSSSGKLYLGYGDSTGNQLTIADGGRVASADGYIGYAIGANNNSILVTGTGSVWNSSGQLFLGYNDSGNNQLTIADGAVVTNASSAFLRGINNNALATGPGSRWDIGNQLTVGTSYHDDHLTVSNGAVVTARGAVTIGLGGSGGNSSIVTGTGSVLNAATQEFRVGDTSPNNQLIIANGGVVSGGTGKLGISGGADNTVIVTDRGSRWSLSGDLNVGDSANGNQLTVTNGGIVTVNSNAVIGKTLSSGNQLTVAGGSLAVTNAAAGGTIDVRRGTLTLNGGTLAVDRFLATNGLLNSIVQFKGGTLATGGSIVSNGIAFAVGDGSQAAALRLAGGTHVFANGVTLMNNGRLTGVGTVAAFLVNGGAVAPGASVGALTILSNYTQSALGALDMELGGAGSNDTLAVGGTAQLGGTLKVTNLDGFTPALSNAFTILTAKTVAGAFAATNLPAVGDAFAWSVTYAPTSVVLRVVNGNSPYALWAQARIPDPGQRNEDLNPDGDAFDNGQEYIADTDPTNPASYFRITAVSNLPPRTVYFMSSTGRVYTLNGCSDLLPGVWTNVPGQGPRDGVGGADQMTDATAVPIRFYRVDVELK